MSCTDEERFGMGTLGRAFAHEAFSWDNIAKQAIDVYRWVIGQADSPDYAMTN